jgi:hypothetical protein
MFSCGGGDFDGFLVGVLLVLDLFGLVISKAIMFMVFISTRTSDYLCD